MVLVNTVKCPGCGAIMELGIHYDMECKRPSCGKWFYEEEQDS
ncbi:hypothetical protein [Brevibacillus porteri]|nr:hypothetical protein [Brevibacillus porteri]MED1801815.1 hypothetical protein [Brevibacillus porteri]MED2134946.1 hypothetical protein [Brevibacillus porteri]MED2745468.1 hypothetical protein [Brevibacillus porteri]MED2815786.1 hypothetical protein [Brevibacillus porteri]MED2897624.1 hypothetical protein [Brevibacillus porteri]